MKSYVLLAAVAFAVPAFAADTAQPANPHAGMSMPAAAPAAPGANPHAGMSMPNAPAAAVALTQTAVVISTQNVPQFTYIEAKQDNKTIWLAAPAMKVKKGDTIRFDNGMVMNNFYSKSLKRTFPAILFANQVVVSKGKK